MRPITTFLFWLGLFLCSFNSIAQQKDSVAMGRAIGNVLDSSGHRPLNAATISVYRSKDSSLVAYQLSGSGGGFILNRLPLDTTLSAIISFMGYRPHFQKILIRKDSKTVDLGKIYLSAQSIDLQEVNIKAFRPPVEMNGDTLEFNADAFKTEKNAVVEDLLKKLPGVILWGDGLITVNGKPVKKVLVDGKPFFGGDAKVAIQNLPKESVDKIQVYQSGDNKKPTLDSAYNINIKLKEGWKSGLFGKIGGGYGTDNRYMADAMLGAFSPKTQLSLAGAKNNNNIVVSDVGMMLRNSSFSGTGINIELQPNFYVQGLNRSSAAGFSLQHDFIDNPSSNRNNRLEASFFGKDTRTEVAENTISIINLKADSNLTLSNEGLAESAGTNRTFKANYKLETGTTKFYASTALASDKGEQTLRAKSTSLIGLETVQSSNERLFVKNNDLQTFSFSSGVYYVPSHLKVDYSFADTYSTSKETNKTLFVSLQNTIQPITFNRSYSDKVRRSSNDIGFKLIDLEDFFFNDNFKKILDISFVNNLKLARDSKDRVVGDIDPVTNSEVRNNYLTNTNTYRSINERPTVHLEMRLERSLTNRYSKSFYFTTDLNGQLFRQVNDSERISQVFTKTYWQFLPYISANYDKYNNFTKYKSSYKLSYLTQTEYPGIDQLVPLVDSANVYFRQLGNLNLKPDYRRELAFTFELTSFRSNSSPTSFNIKLKAGQIKDAIANNISYDVNGRATGQYINLEGSKYWSLNGEARKAFKMKENLLQVVLSPSIINTIEPNYINGSLNQTSILGSDNSLNVSYAIKSFFLMELYQRVYTSRLRQTDVDQTAFKISQLSTRLITSLNMTKKVNLATNITFNRNSSTYLDSYTFTLWNASLLYRFLKGNQGEVKFSALDILRQNRGIINYGVANTFTTGNVNVLQQYFMISLAYYPRIFGKGIKK